MSAEIRAEGQVEPDPAATSIGNDQTANETTQAESTAAVSAAPTMSEDAIKAEQKTAVKAEEQTAEGEPARNNCPWSGSLTDVPCS